MKELLLKRFLVGSPTGTYGALICDMAPTVFTLEPIIPVPPGPYRFAHYDSPKFKKIVFMTQDVPGHDFIELHIGDTILDTKGCILLGFQYGWSTNGYGVKGGYSEPAFNYFMDRKMFGVKEFMLQIVNT